MNTYKITVRDDFFKQDYTGTFTACCLKKAKEQCRDFYSSELDTTMEDVNIVHTELVKGGE